MRCACLFVRLDVWLIHDLLFHSIVSSRASPIEVESFSTEVKRSFIGGELTISWGNVVDFERDSFGRQIKTQFGGLRCPLEILVPSCRLFMHESFSTSIFTDFRLFFGLDAFHTWLLRWAPLI